MPIGVEWTGPDGICIYALPGSDVCGAPAVWHHLAWHGGVPVTMTSCDEHYPIAFKASADWHPLREVCEKPGATWQSRAPGQGFCFTADGDEFTDELSKWADVRDLVGATGSPSSP